MLKDIYRKEAIEYKKTTERKGTIIGWHSNVVSYSSGIYFPYCHCVFTHILHLHPAYRCTWRSHYTPHSINVFAPQQGFIVNLHVKVGDIVKKGQPLYELDVSRNTISGNVSATQIAVINEKITNAEDIISKLTRIKRKRWLLFKQIKMTSTSLTETNRMLAKTQAGLNKMHNNLASYDKYLKDGLITKDQYNYQHSLYFQQQSAYQSLVSQKMQLESQLTQTNSDKITKAADFDNQISNQHNQINDYKNQLVESNANGNIIINATTNGKVESLAVTQGQMVENGSSLAQIKPTGDIEYYLILWLPNNTIPYVKPGDTINIRYDAFPADKFGQFPVRLFLFPRYPLHVRKWQIYQR
jgi:membrane fusion protein